jgi:hypothetical protein
MTLLRHGVLVLAAIGAGAGASAVSLAIPDANGVIHGCYKKLSSNQGTLRVIDSEVGETCSSAEVPLNWNQTGPQGPGGPAGPQGPQGVQGPAGTSATALWAVVEQDGTLFSSSGVVSVQHEEPGSYRVKFAQFVLGCAAVATLRPGAGSSIHAGIVSTNLDTEAVTISIPSGTRVDNAFQMAVFCL